MKSKTLDTVTEESVMALSIVKWVSLASVIGGVVGALITLFIKFFDFTLIFVQQYAFYVVKHI